VWGIGKRRFGKDWGKRMWLFDRLVWTVMGYGVEIWGWKERERMEKLEEKYLRWVLGVDYMTPWYLIREELQREKIRSRAWRRAWGFERRLEEGRGGAISRKCWEERKERVRRGKVLSEWEKERERFGEERGIVMSELGEEWEDGINRCEEWEKGERERQERERWERIKESKYNRWYKWVKEIGVPGYLKKGWGESRWRRIARFRLGCEIRESNYWEEEGKKVCRLCGSETETWEHVWGNCRAWKEGEGGSWQEVVRVILGGEGEGEGWMREVEGERRRGGGEGEQEGERVRGGRRERERERERMSGGVIEARREEEKDKRARTMIS